MELQTPPKNGCNSKSWEKDGTWNANNKGMEIWNPRWRVRNTESEEQRVETWNSNKKRGNLEPEDKYMHSEAYKQEYGTPPHEQED